MHIKPYHTSTCINMIHIISYGYIIRDISLQKQLSKFGIRASRLPGIDSMSFGVDDANLLPKRVKTFLHRIDPTKRGHVGCLYGHVNFLLTAASGEASCGNPPDYS